MNKIRFSEVLLSATFAIALTLFTVKLLLPIIFYSWSHRDLGAWKTTEAQLHSLQIVSHIKRTGRQSYRISPSYTYSVEGEVYNGSEFSYPETSFLTAHSAKKAIEAYFPQRTSLVWKTAFSWDPDSLEIVNLPVSIQIRYYPQNPKYSLLVTSEKVGSKLTNDLFLLFMMIVTTGFVFISSLLGLLFATSFGVWVFQFFESDLSANSKSNAKIRKTEQKPSLKVEPLFKPGKNADFLDWAQYGAGLCAQKQYFEALFALDKAWHLSPGECGTTKIETEIALQQCECLIALERIDQARACLKRVSIYLDDNRFEDLTPRALELTSRLGIDKPEIQKESPLFELE